MSFWLHYLTIVDLGIHLIKLINDPVLWGWAPMPVVGARKTSRSWFSHTTMSTLQDCSYQQSHLTKFYLELQVGSLQPLRSPQKQKACMFA